MRRHLRIALIVCGAVLVVAVGAIGAAAWLVNPNSFKPQIEAAVKRATGRDLALNGRLSLAFSLTPTIEVRNASFSNPPGFSRPQMATLQSVELRLALLPLLSRQIDIRTLVLHHPDILLETNAQGEPNWKLTPQAAPAGQPAAPAGKPAAPAPAKTSVSIQSVRIQDGTIAYRDDRTGKVTTLGLADLTARAAAPDALLHLTADASYNGHPLSVTGDTGSLTRLQDEAATTPWPVKLALAAAGARLSVDGDLTKPLEGRGYTLAVAGSVPDATALAPYLPNIRLPPLHDVNFAAKLTDKGAALPDVTTLVLHAGVADLGALVPGLTLQSLDVNAPAIDQPAKAAASGALRGAAFSVSGTFGALAALLPTAPAAPFPVDLTATAAGATAAAKGTIADPRALTGVNLGLTASIPDLAALSPLLGRPLPDVKAIAFQGRLSDAPGGFRNGVALHGIALAATDGDLTGDLALALTPKPALTATLAAKRIDADAIEAAIDRMPPPPPHPAGAAGAAKPAPPPQPAAPRDRRLFSDHPLHLDTLRDADADITLNIADLRSGGADYHAIATHAVLKGGALTVNPLSADLPGGHLQATLAADASKATPTEHLTLHAPGLALKTILTLLHQPSYAAGNLEGFAELSGSGDSAHAIAASLDGSAGLAMQGGTIDNRLLGSLLGKVMDSLNALNLVGKGGTSALRCFAVRMQAHNGEARVDPLALSSSLLTMTGAGTVNLGAETLALLLRPQARVAGAGLVVPMSVTGPIRNPSVKLNELRTAESNAGTVAGAVMGNATPLGIVGGLLGTDKLTGGSSDICGPALAAARGQPAPPAAAAAAAQQTKQQTKTPSPLSKPAQTLRNLFR